MRGLRDLRGPPLPAAFRRLWCAHAVSVTGDAMTITTMILWAYQVGGGQARLVSATVLAAFLPPVLVGFLLGGVADRYERRRVMVSADVVRVMLAVALAWAAHQRHPTVALAFLALMTGAGALFSAARQATVPNTVEKPQLVRANAIMSLTQQISMVVGAPVAAALFVWLGPPPALLFDAGTFLVSAAVLSGLRLPTRSPGTMAKKTGTAFAGSALPALRAVAASPAVLSCTAAAALLAASAGNNNTVMVMFLDRDLGGHAADIGWLSAANGVAQIVAGGAVVALASRLPLHRVVATAMVAMAVCSSLLAASPAVPVAIAAVVAMALANAPFNISYATMRQIEVPEEVVGRVFALTAALSSGMFLLGSLGGAWLADQTTARTSIAASATCLAVAALLTTPLWRRPAAAPAPPALSTPAALSTPGRPVLLAAERPDHEVPSGL